MSNTKIKIGESYVLCRAIESLRVTERREGAWDVEVRTMSGVTHHQAAKDKQHAEEMLDRFLEAMNAYDAGAHAAAYPGF